MKYKKVLLLLFTAVFLLSCEFITSSEDKNTENTPENTNEEPLNVIIDINNSILGQFTDSGELVVSVDEINNRLSAQVTSVGQFYDPKVYVKLPSLKEDKQYRLSFALSADTSRKVNLKIGTQLPSDPYWAAVYDVSSEMTTLVPTSATQMDIEFHTSDLASNVDLSNLDFIIELGLIDNDNTLTTIHLSELTIEELGAYTEPPYQEELSTLSDSTDSYTPGSQWTLSWSDEFNDGVFDTNTWTRQVLLNPYNEEWQRYTGESDTAWEQDGVMVLKAEHTGTTHSYGEYTSARVISNPGGQNGNSGAEGKTFKYGKIAARIQLPSGKGIWPAFWMLGDNISETGGDTSWPQCGEIDILESGGGSYPSNGQGTITGALHHDPGTETSPAGYNEVVEIGHFTLPNNELMNEDFHVFEIEWDANQIVWKIDGQIFGSSDISANTKNEFHKPFYVLFNIAVSGWYTVPPDESTPFPQYMYIDWIRHYTK